MDEQNWSIGLYNCWREMCLINCVMRNNFEIKRKAPNWFFFSSFYFSFWLYSRTITRPTQSKYDIIKTKQIPIQAVGDQDPYAPIHVQQELFTNLGRGNDRTWSILSDADHAVHLLEGRSRFTNVITSFIMNGKKIGKEILSW